MYFFPGENVGVYHGSEVPLVFGTYPRVNATGFEISLSKYMQTAWVTFAKNPIEGPAGSSWPQAPLVGVLGRMGNPLRLSSLGWQMSLATHTVQYMHC